MNGAESLVHTLIAAGIDTVFANPGTSEMHFVAALDRIPGIRCVLCLHENVVTGAADAYWRMTGKPAATLLHCAPGLANGLANLHNAMRARSAIVNIVGDQATYHRPLDAVLTNDTEGWARPVSGFVRTAATAARVGADAAAAIEAARTYPGQIATLILPADTAWDAGGVVAQAALPAPAPHANVHAVEVAARLLRSGAPTMLLLGGAALMEGPLWLAHDIAQATGAKMLGPVSPARVARGRGRVPLMRIPYPIDMALESLKGIKNLILVGTTEPVAFFAYPGKPGYLYPEDCTVHVLARPDEDGPGALATLAKMLGVAEGCGGPRFRGDDEKGCGVDEKGCGDDEKKPGDDEKKRGDDEKKRGDDNLPVVATGAITPEKLAQSLAALMPEDAIIVDEAISYGRGFYPYTFNAPKHDWVQLTGGAIGAGLPMATGAAIGAPDRRVIVLQADGSGMYTVQALWTQAREKLNVTNIILSNRKYAILLHELANVGANPGPTALNMLDLSNPDLNWVQLSEGMGVPAAQAASMDELNALLKASVERPGPFLIELLV
ncbi:MAG TPA: acetolactate synthase large subunit [Acidocella sp.]|nr:acetolactate synthase large subunit [Acidocella sp.]HQU03394.1 acetolactate synthase large subunit [Acidocella sp.]